jgi:predicted metal-binding membrane protein
MPALAFLARNPGRLLTLGLLALLVLAGWAWLVYEGWAMSHMDAVDMAMPSRGAWTAFDLWLVFAMWAIMMVAMMVPSATPVLLLYQRMVAGREPSAPPVPMTVFFLAGYVLAWTLFSAVATLLQWALHAAALMSPLMEVQSRRVGAAILILAGLYQCTPLKQACLRHCRSPLSFLLNSWRKGKAGALLMGMEHGLYCTGCCWLLMAILFVVGVMNLAWVAAITLFVLVEKLAPQGERVARVSGALLLAWGVWLIVSEVAVL